mmetsp:Transcript_10005/g.17423  ORF Transcript_10005/g.17423 Transcript_10005/m.17423 type:complete len:389 (+) Transcript_10005:1325-2491(+)
MQLPALSDVNVNARPGALPTSASPMPCTSWPNTSSGLLVMGLAVWRTKAYLGVTIGWMSTAMKMGASGMPCAARDRNARSVHLDAHTCFTARNSTCTCEFAVGRPKCFRMSCRAASRSTSLLRSSSTACRTSASTGSASVALPAAASLLALAMPSFTACATAAFTGASSTFSNDRKGSVSDSGTAMPALASLAMCSDLAPTHAAVASAGKTTYLDHGSASPMLSLASLATVSSALGVLPFIFAVATPFVLGAASAVATVTSTSPLARTVTRTLDEEGAALATAAAASYEAWSAVASSTCWLRARMARWDSTSMAVGVTSATTPAGISSLPSTALAKTTGSATGGFRGAVIRSDSFDTSTAVPDATDDADDTIVQGDTLAAVRSIGTSR